MSLPQPGNIGQEESQAWQRALGREFPDMPPAEKWIYGLIFDAEGGMQVNSASDATAGITPDTLARAVKGGAVPAGTLGLPPSMKTIAQAYRFYFKDVLATVGGDGSGIRVLARIGDRAAAAAFADTLFLHSRSGGAKLIQRAINNILTDKVSIDGRMGPVTFAAYQSLARDPASRRRLLDVLADARTNEVRDEKNFPGLTRRIEYFRFSRSP